MKSCSAWLLSLILVATFPGARVVAQEPTPAPMPRPHVDLSGDLQIQPPVQPSEPRRVIPPAPAIPAASMNIGDYIAWDSDTKETTVTAGTAQAHFKFALTNISKEEVTIHNVATSCGCTTAHLPQMPWKLAPGTNAEFEVTMNLAGKSGSIFKTVTVSSDKGTKQLLVKSTIVEAPAMTSPEERERNQKLAMADRQAVFKGECASCHVTPAEGKMGKDLYVAACGVCHDSEHRATMVPNLRMLTHDTDANYWKMMISQGKPGSLMPAFSQSEGGPLNEEQIASLVEYLSATIPSKAASAQASTPAAH